MARLGDKYIAGFLDADGSIGVSFAANTRRPQLGIDFAQNTDQDEVLHRIHEEIGVGSVCVRTSNFGTQYSTLSIKGKDARMLLSRVGQYLVVKRHFAEIAVDVSNRSVEKEEIPKIREYLKIHRYLPSLPLPKHPTRGWVAGYLDGDGCISVSRLTELGQANMVLHVAGDARKVEGIELLQKAFGGRIYDMRNGKCRQWILHMDSSKALSVLSDIAPRMVVKADQAQFLLGCAAMGHFRDGSNIKAGLKHLKAQPHRLNEPKVNVPALIETVRDLPKPKRTDYGQFVRNDNGRIIGKVASA